VRHAAIGDAVPHRASATEQEAQPVPHFQPDQAQTGGNQAFTPDRHGLRPIADKQAPLCERGERAAEMCATDASKATSTPALSIARAFEIHDARTAFFSAVVSF
jgi:hypothetical protein